MTREIPAELAHLPKPQLIEELSYDVLLQGAIERVEAEMAVEGFDFTVGSLIANPNHILAREAAYKEERLRQRINSAMRAMLLAYATGSDLDNYVAHKTVRMSGESDERLVTRYLLLLKGSSTGGPAERYEALALEADIHVAQAFCYRVGKSPVIYLAISSTASDGVADPALIDKVSQHVGRREHRLTNDTIVVRAAVRQIIDIHAQVWLTEKASATIIDGLAEHLKSAWSSRQSIGLDLTRSYIIGQLMVGGVHSVNLPAMEADIVADKYEAIAIGNVTIEYMGKAF
jgi:phage-related baseplate assembly protein